jgi:hypothetical protein
MCKYSNWFSHWIGMLFKRKEKREKRKEGRWKINVPKLILMGLPSLYFSLYVFIFYSHVPFVRNTLIQPIEFFLRVNMTFMDIFQLLFGYIVITSLYKVPEE